MNKKLIPIDFFDAVNKKWVDSHKIPDSKSSIGCFAQLDKNITTLTKKILNTWSEDASTIPNDPIINQLVKFYSLTKNWKLRYQAQLKPINKLLSKINSLNSWKDVENNFLELKLSSLNTPLIFSVSTDFKNSDVQTLYLDVNSTILPDKSFYTDPAKKEKFINVWKNMVLKLLNKIDKNESKNNLIIENALKWDELTSSFLRDSEFYFDMVKICNTISTKELAQSIKTINIENILRQLIKCFPDEINAIDPNSINIAKSLTNEENFEYYKASLIIDAILTYAPYFDYSTIQIASEFNLAINGNKKIESKEKYQIKQAKHFFDIPFGTYYGKTYFGLKNKQTVEHMIKSMIDVYKEQLTKNSWLSKQTKEKAITKLNSIGVYVGFPEKIQDHYKYLIVEEFDGYNDLFENVLKFNRILAEHILSEYGKAEDKNLWHMSPAMVNAYYNPSKNVIVFPAAILQKPFFSADQSSSSNFGGIGAVIAHEISHGFDNNGANFDEKGNMINWWTEEDKKAFEVKTKEMINLFEGRETSVGKCNGTLTVSENIADAGGLSCALAAAKLEKDYNPKDFYINFATIWRTKYRPELQSLLLTIDCHAPAKLRTNVQIQNSDDFYTTFNVKKGDPMYLSPEKRVKIW